MSEQAYWERFGQRRLSRRSLIRGGAVAGGALALAAAGCTSSSGSVAPTAVLAPTAAPVAVAPTAGPTAAPTVAPTPVQNIKRGGIAASGFQGSPPNFEVGAATRQSVIAETFGGVWNQLVRYRAQNFNDNTIVPDLADSWSVSADGRAWTFKLNARSKWQNLPPLNGRDFTSDDVKWNWKYYTDPKVNSFLAPMWANLTDIETPDKKTVVFRLDKPLATFLDRFANSFMKMQAKEIFDADGNFQKTLVGTGPFLLDKNEANVSASFKRNPDYWKTGADGKALPYLDGYAVFAYQNANTVAAQMAAANYTWTPPGGGFTRDEAEALAKGGKVRVVPDFGPTLDFIRLNVSRPPFDKLDARRALALAIDQADVLDIIRDKEGRFEGFVPSAIENFALPDAELKQKYKFDLTEAKRLAQSSGLAGQKIKMTSRVKSGYFDTGSQYFQQRFKEIGLELELDYFPDSATFNRVQAGGDFQMLFVPEAFNGDVDNWVYGIWHSKSPTNFGKVNDPRVDKFADDQRAELDAAKRKAIIQDFQRYMIDQAYWIPLPSQTYRNGYQTYVKNFNRHWSFGMPGLEECWLDK